MVSTVSAQVTVKRDRTLRLKLPSSVPVGPAEVIVIVAPKSVELASGTASELAASPLFGLWRNRTDIPNSIAYARQLRARGERRAND